MPNLIDTPAWQALLSHQRETAEFHMRDLFASRSRTLSIAFHCV